MVSHVTFEKQSREKVDDSEQEAIPKKPTLARDTILSTKVEETILCLPH